MHRPNAPFNNVPCAALQFEEHAKRVWSVDVSPADPTRLASASDDGTVKLWATTQEHSVATLACKVRVGKLYDHCRYEHSGGRKCWPH